MKRDNIINQIAAYVRSVEELERDGAEGPAYEKARTILDRMAILYICKYILELNAGLSEGYIHGLYKRWMR